MKLKIIHYHYDVSNPEEKEEWDSLCRKLEYGRHQHCSHSFGQQPFTGNSVEIVEVDTNCVFDDQFNTTGEQGKRLFDWYLQHRLTCKSVKQGHYVEDLSELNELRARTFTCGYCGKVSNKEDVFCKKCIGSEFLDKDQLHLLRLKNKSVFMVKWEELSDEESKLMVGLWEIAQGLGKITREEKIESKRRQQVEKLVPDAEFKALQLVEKAKFKREAYTWLLDNKFKDINNTIINNTIINNTIIYKNFVLTFGWNRAIEDKEKLKSLLKDAPFEWEIKGLPN